LKLKRLVLLNDKTNPKVYGMSLAGEETYDDDDDDDDDDKKEGRSPVFRLLVGVNRPPNLFPHQALTILI